MEEKNHLFSKRKLSSLNAYKNNSRIHSDKQISQIVSSMKEFGITNPVLIDENSTIIAGHCRVLAATKLGMEDIPCVELIGLTESQKKAYVVADNQLALNATWDIDMLKLEVEELKELDFDVDLLGFDDDFLDNLDPLETEEDNVLKEDEYSEKFSLIIDCDDELHQEVTFKKLCSEGYSCQVQSL